jgi:hypothetical protein
MYHIDKRVARSIFLAGMVGLAVLAWIALDTVKRLEASQTALENGRAPLVTEVDMIAAEALWWSESSNTIVLAYLKDDHETAIQEIQAQDDRLHNFIGIGNEL